MIAWSDNGSATSWKIGSCEAPLSIQRAPNHGKLLDTTEDYVVTGSEDGQVAVLDSRSGSSIGIVRHVGQGGAPSAIRTAAVSQDGARLLTCGGDEVARLWRVSDGALIESFPHSASNQTGLVGERSTKTAREP